MSADGVVRPTREWSPPWLGTAGAVFGVVAAVATVLIGLVSFTPLDPPGWFRIAMVWTLIVSLVVSLLMDVVGLFGKRRAGAIVGIVLCLASVAAMAVMLSIGE